MIVQEAGHRLTDPWGVDPLGAVGWDFRADPMARPVECPPVDASLFECVGEDPEAEAMWEASVSPAGLIARARAERADDLVGELERIDAEQARLEARKAIALAALTAAVGGSSPDPVRRLHAPAVAASELAAALRISQRAAGAAVAEALTLARPAFEPVLEGMASGYLPRRRAVAVLDAAAPVPPERLAAFAAAAAAMAAPPPPAPAPSQGTLRRRLRRLAEEHAAEPLAARRERAAAHRRVDLEPAQDGMCWLSAYLPLEAGAAIDTRLEALARSLQGPGEERTLGQLRADALTDLLTGTGTPALPDGAAGHDGAAGAAGAGPAGGVRLELIVTVPARTLTRQAEAPGEITGYGPIDPETARALAAHAATWSHLALDPATGAPLSLSRHRYTPTAAMRRFLGARDATCRFPGCDTPAAATEADHTTEWSQGGTTGTDNLALLCRQHHRLKTLGHWNAHHTPPPTPPGTLHWTAPSGRTHTTHPEPNPPPPF